MVNYLPLAIGKRIRANGIGAAAADPQEDLKIPIVGP
jgi:hypothetical protein